MERRRDIEPPDDVVVALFQYMLAEARTRWKTFTRIQVGLGTPYTLRPPSFEVIHRLHQVAVLAHPYTDQYLMGGDLLLGIDVDAMEDSPSPRHLSYKAHAWMISHPPHESRTFCNTVLSVLPSDPPSKTCGSGRSTLTIRRDDPRKGWEDNVTSVIFRDKAAFFCPLPEHTGLIRPERDAILTVFMKADKALYLGRWNRKTRGFTESLLVPPRIFGRATWARSGPMSASQFVTMSLSPERRYLSWLEQPKDDDYGLLIRCVLDMRNPSSVQRIPLPKHAARGPATWLSEDEWIEVIRGKTLIFKTGISSIDAGIRVVRWR